MADGTDPLLAPWETLVERIVAFEYDCSFEWRGETDGSHDSYQDSSGEQADHSRIYKVYVDDNARPDDREARYLQGEYQDCQSALRACRTIVDEFLEKAFSEAQSFNQMWATYTSWGEDPFIVGGGDDSPCSFSAWEYARRRIREFLGEVPNSTTTD